jgi:tRNA(fMet)-specific endonuclease VapC
MFVLDTNTIIYFFKGMGQVASALLSTPPADVAIPSVVLYELEYGVAKSKFPKKMKAQLDSLIEPINILSLGHKEAIAAARIRANLEKNGTPIGPYDVLIAASALAGGHTLVTHNINEFERIKNLNLVDWY